MTAFRRYLIAWAAWGLGITGLALLTAALDGDAGGGTVLVNWTGGAFMLAAFPAGVHASRAAITWDGDGVRGVAGLLSAAVLAGLAVVAFRAVIGPAFVSDAAGDPASWTFFERLERLAGAEAAALETGTLAAWQTANRIG